MSRIAFGQNSYWQLVGLSAGLLLNACSGSEVPNPVSNAGGDQPIETGGTRSSLPSGGSTHVLGSSGGIPGSGGSIANTGGALATGGVPSTGGNTAVGGSFATGGKSSTGGTASAGGSSASGGSSNTGGIVATGGSKASGGTAATGGSKAIGGAAPTGGTPATGGSKSTGGTPASGGSKATGGAAATGGSKPTGGAAATGGSASTSACATTTTGTCPATLTCPTGASGTISCGCYLVNGLGATKKALLDAGASAMPYYIASAMIETETMLTSSYAQGDGKTGDSFNAGSCKQNWGMIRTCHTAWNGLAASSYLTSTVMNGDTATSRALDIQVYIECRNYYGTNWWAGHRNGSSGLANPNTADIQNFKTGEDWTYQQLQNGHMCDNVRFWVSLPAILIR